MRLTSPQRCGVKLPKVMVPSRWVWCCFSMVVQTLLAGAVQAVATGLSEGVPAAVVFVNGGDVAGRK